MKFAYTVLYVADVPKTLHFYEKAFGCTIRFLHEHKHYGELETGAVALGFASEETALRNMGAFERNTPNKLPAGFEIAFTTDDVQRAYDHAVSCGAQPVNPPTQRPWGQLVGYVRDLNGILVEICSSMQ